MNEHMTKKNEEKITISQKSYCESVKRQKFVILGSNQRKKS